MIEKSRIEEKINEIIECRINPILSEHMGGVLLSGYKEGVAYIKFTGSCRGCYAAEDTLEDVVKPILFEEISELREVYLDQSVSEDILLFARKLLRTEGQKCEDRG